MVVSYILFYFFPFKIFLCLKNVSLKFSRRNGDTLKSEILSTPFTVKIQDYCTKEILSDFNLNYIRNVCLFRIRNLTQPHI